MATSKYTLYKYVKVGGAWRYCKAAYHDLVVNQSRAYDDRCANSEQFHFRPTASGCFGWYRPTAPPPGSRILVIEPHRAS
jgi:hypothetical protein